MDHYYLTKEHWDAMLELHLEGESMLKQIPTAVKSAFTREYNKGSHPIAFQEHAKLSAVKASASMALKPDIDEAIEEDAEESQETSDEAEDDTDALVKPVKPTKRAPAKAKAKAKDGATTQRKRRKV
ncbi:DNA replication factor C complex subunit Rfc1 [Coemansia sp. RSA 678]|nr:DNA replication factor C complex subunit Rfc1 [Coemansia sp. RSA 678]